MKLRHRVIEGLLLSPPFLMFGIAYMSGSYSAALLVGLFLSVPLLTLEVICASCCHSTTLASSSDSWKSGSYDATDESDPTFGAKRLNG